MNKFWKNLSRPIVALAPMEDVTDTVFRQIVAQTAKPSVFFTEFVNVEGLCSKGREMVLPRLKFTNSEHPLIAQVWGIDPKNYITVAKEIVSLGFDGIDINMGCPQKDVVKHGACAALINNHGLAKEIVVSVRESFPDFPLSIKTRIGYSQIETEDWIGFLLSLHPDAITVHGRTRKEMSKVPAHWDEIGKAVKLRNAISPDTIIIGNGDIENFRDAIKRVRETQVDGVMIGRGVFKNLWVFDPHNSDHHTPEELLSLLEKHLLLFKATWGNIKPYQIMKKYFKIYIKDFPGANEVRLELMETTSIEEAINILHKYPHF